MVNLQTEFIEFHKAIKLSYSSNTELCEKRETLLKKLKENMPDEAASFDHFNQGSYAMHTGIKPNDGDYDIDVGLRFSINHLDYPDPIAVKQWVYDALEGHTKSVEIRRSCVTITYQEEGEDAYHVDFACYADENDKLYIAKGKRYSEDDKRYWELSDPLGLIEKMEKRFSDKDDRAQFRRIIRYMKKWKNVHFEISGNSAPTGIAITSLAYYMFSPKYENNIVDNKRVYDDFHALKSFVEQINSAFKYQYNSDDAEYYYTIEQNLFVEPYNDLFKKMSMKQQDEFHSKIVDMISKLNDAEKKEKKAEACAIMTEIFGEEFPVKTDRSYVGHSESASCLKK